MMESALIRISISPWSAYGEVMAMADWLEEPVTIPIDGLLDLHHFNPRELDGLLDDYLSACRAKGILDVRIIHGKGRGILRQRVQRLLLRHPLVADFGPAPADEGGWGACRVRLKGPR